jgi:SagB-type dehydrogenase family enzyme
MKKAFTACLLIGLFLFMSPQFSSSQGAAQAQNVIKLPPPQTEGGMPVMKALKLRQSTRGNFGPEEKLSLQTLSNLLWAADGVNRPDGHRTAPSAADWQNIQIYLTTADGVFLYDAPQHVLKVISTEDVRATAGIDGSGKMRQDFVKTAPLNLVYVADMAKTKGMKWQEEDVGATWSFANVGAIAENVYLFCASEGLACILRAMFDPAQIAKTFQLRPDQRVILSQTVAQFKK